jgi:hypothetical protein
VPLLPARCRTAAALLTSCGVTRHPQRHPAYPQAVMGTNAGPLRDSWRVWFVWHRAPRARRRATVAVEGTTRRNKRPAIRPQHLNTATDSVSGLQGARRAQASVGRSSHSCAG